MQQQQQQDARINDVQIEKTQTGEEVHIFNPYNSLNTEITEQELNQLLQEYGIPPRKVTADCLDNDDGVVFAPLFHNFNLYRRAFIHKSYVKKTADSGGIQYIVSPKPDDCQVALKTKSNDRLEFVGDGVLECITKYYLYTRFPKADEGFMTDTKIALVKNDALGQMVLDMGLEKWYVLSKNAEQKRTRQNIKKLGNLFEAFVGALFLDYNKIDVKDEDGWFKDVFLCGPGFQMAQIFITNIFDRHVNWSRILENNDNHKNKLQVMIQKEFKCVPQYLEINVNTERGYCMGVYLCLGQSIHHLATEQAISINEFEQLQDIHNAMSTQHRLFILLGTGTHKIKKKAEQMACEVAIRNYLGL